MHDDNWNRQPIVGSDFSTLRLGWAYAVTQFSADSSAIVAQHECVVDDFGELVALGAEATERNHQFWWSYRNGLDEAAFAWLEGEDVRRAAQRREEARRQRCVEVDVVRDPEGFCGRPLTEIRIGDDARGHLSATYRLDVAGNSDGPLWLTQGQLAALLVAAEELLKPARAPRHAPALPEAAAIARMHA